MKKLVTIALLFAAGIANAHSFGNFSDRKGSLHMPVDKKDATFVNWEAVSNAKPELPAVKFSGKDNAPVHVVYAGKISSIVAVEGRQIVIVQHGNYFTIYEGVENIKVTKDQEVTEGQLLGTVNNSDHILTFQMWMSDNGKPTTLTAAEWLAK